MQLSPEAFWRLTPRQFMALCDRLRAGERRQDARAALVASVIANVSRDPKRRAKPYQVSEFMPQEDGGRQSPEAQAGMLQALASALRKR